MLRFTIRELLILTVTAGLAVGWWLDRRQLVFEASRQAGLAKEWRFCAGGLETLLNKDDWYVYRGDGQIGAKKYGDSTKTGFTMRTVPDNQIEPKLNSDEARPAEIDWRFLAPHLSALRD